MAKKKYTADKDGWYSTLVWDGTYDQYGRKLNIIVAVHVFRRPIDGIATVFTGPDDRPWIFPAVMLFCVPYGIICIAH